jgi:hypothetical protein
MTEISASLPGLQLPVSSQSPPQTSAADLAVKLLQPLAGLMANGESASAEVLSLKETPQSFQLTLRLTLEGGRQTIIQTSSAQALSQGTSVTVTALSDTALALSTLTPLSAPATAPERSPQAPLASAAAKPMSHVDLEQFPVGSLVQGKVISREPAVLSEDSPSHYKLLITLLNSQLPNRQLVVETSLDLPLGSLVSARVQDGQSLRFLPMSHPLEQPALTQQLASQYSRQGSLSGVLSALQSLPLSSLPESLRSSVDRLLGALPGAEQLSSGKGLAQALENSGLFLEARLANGQTGGLNSDMKANLLRLISQLLPGLPSAAPLAAATSNAMSQALPPLARTILGKIDQLNARQQTMRFPLSDRAMPGMEEPADLDSLLKLAAAAIARLQTHQLSSLGQTETTAEGMLQTTWQMEIPLHSNPQLIPLQVRIQHEEPTTPNSKQEPMETQWQIALAFDLAPLGPLQVQAQLTRHQLSSQLWAEQPGTAALIDQELPQLRQRLNDAGLHVDSLVCHQGTPPQPAKAPLEQRWVDETA